MNNQSEDEKISVFETESDEIKTLLDDGAQKYFSVEFPDIKRAFAKNLQCAVCIDEGTAHKDYGGENKFCIAGSGMLLPASDNDERIKKAARLFTDLGISEVTSHDGCGAAGLAYRRDFPDAQPTAQQIEEYAKDWAKKVAEEMGRLGHEENYSHIPADEMERPIEFHVARLVYYDGIGGFNPDKEIGLPMGFVIERKFVPAEYAQEELRVAVNIAFGHHGFGELFSKERPFAIIAFASDSDRANELKTEIQDSLKENEHFKAEKIKIDAAVIA